MRTALMILAVIQIAWPAGLALLTGSADGMTGIGLAALLAAQAVGAAGLVMLVQTEQQFSRQTVGRATALLAVSLASNLLLAVTNLLGVTAGHWCLPLVLGLIPTIACSALIGTFGRRRLILTSGLRRQSAQHRAASPPSAERAPLVPGSPSRVDWKSLIE